MKEVVAFIGVVGSGKDYQADVLKKEGHILVNFKDALVEMCSDLAGYDIMEDYDWFKTHPVGMRKPPIGTQNFANMDTKDLIERFPQIMTGRRMLQRFGTEVMRKRDEDYWANQWFTKVRNHLADGNSVTAADCRFLNEVEVVNRCALTSRVVTADVKFIFCDYRSDRYNPNIGHKSEQLAQILLKMGMKNGEEIGPSDFAEAREVIEDATVQN